MKDLVQIWNSVANRRYSSVNTSELKDLPQGIRRSEIENFEANFVECEALNSKFNDDLEFNNKKDAIINRLFERRRKGQIGRQPKCLFVLLMLGFFALSSGCFILFLKPYDFFFSQKAVLSDGGEIFEMWRKPEVELYLKVYLFNVTNAEEYMAGTDDKVKVKEVGPYVYRESLEHKITKFNDNNTLSAVPVHPLSWVEELSEGNQENDTLYLVNIALLSIANVASSKDAFTRFGLNNVISFTNSQPFVQMTAREFMMGYKSELMTLGNTFLPGWIYFDKLGLIDRMYDFDGDYETVFTGAEDVRNSGLIDTYRGSTDLPQWTGKHCSNVQYASDGTKFRGAVSKNESILFYRKSLCRAAPLIPVDEGVKSGLRGYKYTFPENMLDNGEVIKENECFCRNGKCLPNGLIDVTDCYYGFPIALSYPHFWKADDIVSSKVEGLTPDPEKHETAFWIEPQSGLPLEVSSKFQINMALGDISSMRNVDKFSNMYLPLLWFDIKMYSLPPSMQQRFSLYLNILPIVEQGAMYALFVTGALFILTTVYILTFKVMFRKSRDFNDWKEKDGIYAPCEVPLSDTDTDDNGKSLIKYHSEKIKDLSSKFSDKMYDTVGSVKGKVVDEINHVKHAFDKKDCKDEKGYAVVKQSDSEDDCKYLEVIDDGSDLVSSQKYETNRMVTLKGLEQDGTD
ncbi:scavenger receptor class B member 1-like isoform X1 [Anticarsia gemmatalis]|uniref:scavenger receptor class B member 1-like isoform X1 n=1 Tax=Anticarsia gemmatalis TaxID=129554 RepID=UPI003F76DA48